jgi:hypothetical protein
MTSTILNTIRWLSIFTGALSLFYLGNAWFEFGLGEVFTRIYAWYADILHPDHAEHAAGDRCDVDLRPTHGLRGNW